VTHTANGRLSLEQRRQDAEQRLELRASRTPEAQLERLDSLLGVGRGARKERARLHALVVHSNTNERADAPPKPKKAKKTSKSGKKAK
jgi:hypothetical protein